MMGVGDTIAFLGALGAILVGLNLVVEAYKSRLDFKRRALELKAPPTAAPGTGASELARLEKRVRVLERIATDSSTLRGSDVALQIEALRHEREGDTLLEAEGRA